MAEARAAIDRKDYVSAYEQLLPLANASDARAQRLLGALYRFGLGRQRDRAAAHAWYERAALNGDRIAQFFVGRAYKFGNQVQKNDRKAFEWFLKAAKAGHLKAQGEVALAYQFGIGTTRSLTNAVFWYEKSAKRDLVTSLLSLAEMYRFGNSWVSEDIKRAISLYQRAASRNEPGSARALKILGDIHADPTGPKADSAHAYAYYRLSEKQFETERERLIEKRERMSADGESTILEDRSLPRYPKYIAGVAGAARKLRESMSPEQIGEAERLIEQWAQLIGK